MDEYDFKSMTQEERDEYIDRIVKDLAENSKRRRQEQFRKEVQEVKSDIEKAQNIPSELNPLTVEYELKQTVSKPVPGIDGYTSRQMTAALKKAVEDFQKQEDHDPQDTVGWIVFYINVGNLSPFKADALVDRWKDRFKTKRLPKGYDFVCIPGRNIETRIEVLKFLPAEEPETKVEPSKLKLLSDYDILTKFFNMTHEEAEESILRMKKQKFEDLKMQMMADNPELFDLSEEDRRSFFVDTGDRDPEELIERIKEVFAKKKEKNEQAEAEGTEEEG